MKRLTRLLQHYLLPPAIYEAIKKIVFRRNKNIEMHAQARTRAGNELIQADSKENSTKSHEVPSLVKTLCRNYQAAKAEQINISKPYKPDVDWAKLLETRWNMFREAIALQDFQFVENFFGNFFRTPVMEGFWGETADTFIRSGAVEGFEKQYAVWRELEPSENIANLEAPLIGNPWGFRVDGCLLLQPIFEYWWQAGCCKNLLFYTSKPVIIEIGGGFGGLAYALGKRLPKFCYIGFDLPENIALQHYYLAKAFPDKQIIGSECFTSEPLSEDKLKEHDFVLLPNFMLSQMPAQCADLVINVRSLAEMPYITILEYLKQIDRIGKRWFFHENIYKNRKDSLHGIPTTDWPSLQSFVEVYRAVSRWPRYNAESGYPCAEYLYLHKQTFMQ